MSGERVFVVTFPDGEVAHVYARFLSIAYGKKEVRRRVDEGETFPCFGYMCALDAEVDVASEFRKLSAEDQVSRSRDLPFAEISAYLMGADEKLTVNDFIEAMPVRGPIAMGFYERQSQQSWERARLALFGEEPHA